jgi:hypothetical protein
VKDASKREQAPSRSKKEPEPASSQVLALEDDNKRRPTRGRSSSPVNKSRKKKDQPLAIQDAPPKRAPSRRKQAVSTPPVIALEDDASRRRAPSTGRSRSPAKPERERREQMLAIADVAKMPPAEQALHLQPRDAKAELARLNADVERARKALAAAKAETGSAVRMSSADLKRSIANMRQLDKEKKEAEKQYQKRMNQLAKGGSMKKKQVKHNPVVEYHDLADDPYVMKPRLRIPERQQK